MKVVTRELVKKYLQIEPADTSKDGIIDDLIKPATLKAFKKTNNYFHIPNQYVQNYQISFDASTRKISNGNSDFIQVGNAANKFSAGLFVHVKGSLFNDGIFLIATASASELTLDSKDQLITEGSGQYVRISLLNIPEDFKHSICEFIGYLMIKKSNIKSETIGKFSVSYKDEKEALQDIFRTYTKVSFS